MARCTNRSPSLEPRVALVALRGEGTVSEVATKHESHPMLLRKWERQAAESLVEVFASGGCHGQEAIHATKVEGLRAVIVKLAVQRDYLHSAFRCFDHPDRDRRIGMIDPKTPGSARTLRATLWACLVPASTATRRISALPMRNACAPLTSSICGPAPVNRGCFCDQG